MHTVLFAIALGILTEISRNVRANKATLVSQQDFLREAQRTQERH